MDQAILNRYKQMMNQYSPDTSKMKVQFNPSMPSNGMPVFTPPQPQNLRTNGPALMPQGPIRQPQIQKPIGWGNSPVNPNPHSSTLPNPGIPLPKPIFQPQGAMNTSRFHTAPSPNAQAMGNPTQNAVADAPVDTTPHQAFIQNAIGQGFPPDMVMQFLKHKAGL